MVLDDEIGSSFFSVGAGQWQLQGMISLAYCKDWQREKLWPRIRNRIYLTPSKMILSKFGYVLCCTEFFILIV